MTGQNAEAREQIARALWEAENPAYADTFTPADLGRMWSNGRGSWGQQEYLIRADAVLAVPAVAEALAAVERVRALCDRLERGHWRDSDSYAKALRRALDGET